MTHQNHQTHRIRTPRTRLRSTIGAVLGVAVLSLGLVACGDDDGDSGDQASASEQESESPTDAAADVSVTDPWVKAVDGDMTAMFGTITNDGDEDVVVTGAETDAAGMVELHETVANDDGSMAMQEKEGGFTIPAHGEHELAPGGDHVMLMDVSKALKPGQTVTLTLSLEGGDTVDVEAPVKRFTGADENYQGGEHGDDHGDDHGDHGDHGDDHGHDDGDHEDH